jgi:hypothetical protein
MHILDHLTTADAIREAREAALADEGGRGLDQALARHGAPGGRSSRQPIRFVRRRMSFLHTTEFSVEFGDCDPAGIVFYPNFFRWMDAASRHFFTAAGVLPWRELEARDGILGTPLVDASAHFERPRRMARPSRSTRRSPSGAARAS